MLEPDSYRMKELVDECRNNSTDLVLVGFAFVRFFCIDWCWGVAWRPFLEITCFYKVEEFRRSLIT